MPDLEKLIAKLVEAGVDFVIVGGVAGTVHGSSYVTYDLDVCYARDDHNLQRLVKALSPVTPRLRGVPADLPFVLDIRTLKIGLNFTLTTDIGDVDLLGEIAGIGSYLEVRAASVSVELFGVSCAVLSLDALIAAKRAAGRPKDHTVLPELEALQELRDRKDGSSTRQAK